MPSSAALAVSRCRAGAVTNLSSRDRYSSAWPRFGRLPQSTVLVFSSRGAVIDPPRLLRFQRKRRVVTAEARARAFDRAAVRFCGESALSECAKRQGENKRPHAGAFPFSIQTEHPIIFPFARRLLPCSPSAEPCSGEVSTQPLKICRRFFTFRADRTHQASGPGLAACISARPYSRPAEAPLPSTKQQRSSRGQG